MLPKTASFDALPKNFRASLRRTQSVEGSDIFDYMDEGISRSPSQYSGILTIAPPSAKQSGDFSNLSTEFVVPPQPKNEEPLRRKLVGFLKNTIKIIPLMQKSSTDSEKDLNQNQAKKEEEERKEEEEETTAKSARFQSKDQAKKVKSTGSGAEDPMDSESAVYEIDELNSTIAPSSSRQCIVEAVTIKKPKKKAIQRTDFHPRPPFSCVPIYTAILLGLLIVLIVGAVTTIVDMRPAFIYGEVPNSTHLGLNETLTSIVEPPPPINFSTLKPQ
ncbi:hypothetical protein L5515_002011 [Caenorhabditis briggsae]|uniref:Uncharacterized protein n=2 Tax=Caenorhabditis briggsae TaxID=6238 RepID=A0AAE9E729_CAEBR|nr:hypothetical protein L5515_002011 [Caenorhabditis briggsae]